MLNEGYRNVQGTGVLARTPPLATKDGVVESRRYPIDASLEQHNRMAPLL